MTAERTTTFGGVVASLVTAVSALALGGAVGAGWSTAAGVVGAVILVASARATIADDNVALAKASLGVVLGASVLAAGLGLAVSRGAVAVVGLASVAVLLVGLDAATNAPGESATTLGAAAARSASVVVAGALLAVLVDVTTAFDLVPRAAGTVGAVTSVSTFALLVSLQVEALLVAYMLRVSMPVLDDWVRGSNAGLEGTIADLVAVGERLEDVPRGYWALLGGQLVLAILFPGSLDAVLSTMGEFGAAVRTALASRALHVPFELLLLVLAGVVVADLVRELVVLWGSPKPPRSLALSTGGLAATIVVVIAGFVPSVAAVASNSVASATWLSSIALALGALVGLLGGLVLLLAAVDFGTSLVPVPDLAPGFALGAGALFALALAGGLSDVVAPVAFGVAAAAFVVWDAGANAAELGLTMDLDARTERGEFVRTTSSVLVGLGAVVLATAALYLLGPLSVSVPAWRASLALALSLVALAAFALANVKESAGST